MTQMNLTVNGVALNTYAYNVVNRGSRWKVPGRRGANLTMPGVHGSVHAIGKPYDENTLTISMWALGANSDGSLPADKNLEKQCLSNLDMLSRLFSAPILDARQTLPDGSVRQCSAEVVQAIDFTSMAGGTRAEFAVELIVPKAFWFDLSTTSQSLMTGATGSGMLTFTSFAAATAPLTGALYEVTGPISNPLLSDPSTGQWVRLGKTVAAGQKWSVNSATWQTTLAGQNVLGDTTHGFGTTFLDLTPGPQGPTIYWSGTNTSTATSIKVTAKRAYFLA